MDTFNGQMPSQQNVFFNGQMSGQQKRLQQYTQYEVNMSLTMNRTWMCRITLHPTTTLAKPNLLCQKKVINSVLLWGFQIYVYIIDSCLNCFSLSMTQIAEWNISHANQFGIGRIIDLTASNLGCKSCIFNSYS
jgi:hypothetical protein